MGCTTSSVPSVATRGGAPESSDSRSGGSGVNAKKSPIRSPVARISSVLQQSGRRSSSAAFGAQYSMNEEGSTFSRAEGGAEILVVPHSPAAVMAGALDTSERHLSTLHFNDGDSVKETLSRRSWSASRLPEESSTDNITFVILGASSARTLNKLFPCLLSLFETALIDQDTSRFAAVGLDDYTDGEYRSIVKRHLPKSRKRSEFLSRIRYYDSDCTRSQELEKIPTVGRLIYFSSLPPSVQHEAVMKAINESSNVHNGARLILFGDDPQTYDVEGQNFLLTEDHIFRINPFAGSDALHRVMGLRFGNRILEPTWNRNHIKAVLIDFSLDPYATYELVHNEKTFLRDVFYDNLLSLVALIAMERPASRFGDDVRDAKIEVLEAIQPIRLDQVVLGRCGNETSPAFSTVILEIDTNRWRGVPFIVRFGKDMARTQCEAHVLFRPAAGADVLWRDQVLKNNELTIRVFPSENAILDLISNLPGLSTQLQNHHSTLDFLSQAPPYMLEPFERLVYDAIRGRRANFVRKDALGEASRIFKPLLASLYKGRMDDYPSGTSFTGPYASDELISRTVKDCPWIKNRLQQLEAWSRTTDYSVQREMELSLRLSFDQMRLIVRDFAMEMKNKNNSTIKMLETYVTKLPNGEETGQYYGLDMGGTNFRVIKFELSRGGPIEKLAEKSWKIPQECKHGKAEELFDFFADCISQIQTKDEEAIYGFTFSFPTKQETIATGRLISWTKGWTTSGVVDEEVSSMLHAALERKGLRGKVAALINDTVGTLAARAQENKHIRIGVILGTGTNAAFMDAKEDGTFSVINTEWGGFGSSDRITSLPFTKVDNAIDKESPVPGAQRFEKMISGFYLGEITRKWLVHLFEAKELWKDAEVKDGAALFSPFALDSEQLSNIELDLTDGLKFISNIEESVLGVSSSSLRDRVLFRMVCRAVLERSARLVACAISALVDRVNIPGTVIAVDGSLFEADASFKQRLIAALDRLGCTCSLLLSKDGSGIGSALVAAAASSNTGQTAFRG